MEINTDDYKKLEKLEESLWLAETRFDKNYMEDILADDFFEFGRSGRVYKREDTIHGVRSQEINTTLPLKNFTIKLIDNNIVLITYVSEVQYEELEVANRSSIWLKGGTGWKLKFHQGTPVNIHN